MVLRDEVSGSSLELTPACFGVQHLERNTWHEKLRFSLAHDRRPWAVPLARRAVPLLAHLCAERWSWCSTCSSCTCATSWLQHAGKLCLHHTAWAHRQICAVPVWGAGMSVLPVNAFRYLLEHPHCPSTSLPAAQD